MDVFNHHQVYPKTKRSTKQRHLDSILRGKRANSFHWDYLRGFCFHPTLSWTYKVGCWGSPSSTGCYALCTTWHAPLVSYDSILASIRITPKTPWTPLTLNYSLYSHISDIDKHQHTQIVLILIYHHIPVGPNRIRQEDQLGYTMWIHQ